ncbi:MAG: PadR family transcriptional regulator [Candidatus Heimdallarchaeota archaeon]
MTRKNLNFIGTENNFNRFKGQNPPEKHRSSSQPPFRGPPPFGQLPPYPVGYARTPIPIDRESFQEIRDYMLLLIISEHTEGVTGYKLQEKYHLPRGTLVRTLQDLEEKGYLKANEEIIDGRSNKFYLITLEGKKFLEDLKLKWANIFGTLAEINPVKGMEHMLKRKIKEFETIEDAMIFFKSLRDWQREMLEIIEKRTEKFKTATDCLDVIINEIDTMETLNRRKIREMVHETAKRIEEVNLKDD